MKESIMYKLSVPALKNELMRTQSQYKQPVRNHQCQAYKDQQGADNLQTFTVSE